MMSHHTQGFVSKNTPTSHFCTPRVSTSHTLTFAPHKGIVGRAVSADKQTDGTDAMNSTAVTGDNRAFL